MEGHWWSLSKGISRHAEDTACLGSTQKHCASAATYLEGKRPGKTQEYLKQGKTAAQSHDKVVLFVIWPSKPVDRQGGCHSAYCT